MNKKNSIKEFSHVLENDALLDIFSTAGITEEVNQDSFEISSSKNLTILILACGQGGGSIGEIVSSMASEKALELLESYRYDQNSSEEILAFLKSIFPLINKHILDYLHSANIQGYSTSLSVALIYKNSLYVAHIGESRIYVIRRDETPTLLSFDPSYSQKLSKKSLQSSNKNYFLGDESFSEDNISLAHEMDLLHKERLFLCNKHVLDTIPEIKFDNNIMDIETLLEAQPPLTNAIFLRYLHYERSVEKIKISMDEVAEESDEREIDWEKLIPFLKKVALAVGVLLLLGFFYLVWSQLSSKAPTVKDDPLMEKRVYRGDINETKVISDRVHSGVERATKPSHSSLLKTIEKGSLEAQEKPSEVVEDEPKSVKTPPPTPIKEEPKVAKTAPVLPKKEEPPKVESHEQKVDLSGQKLELLPKKDSTILHVGTEGMRITFKENRLVASRPDTFSENENGLYCQLKGTDTDLHGEITNDLKNQTFSDRVTVERNHEKNTVTIRVEIKNNCSYTQSAWGKKSGLDLLIFSCVE